MTADTTTYSPLVEKYLSFCESKGTKPNGGIIRSLQGPIEDVQTLDLALNFVGKNGIIPVVETASVAPNLKTLILKDNFISNEALLVILDKLRGHPALETLDLSNNPISHTSAKPLMAFIRDTKLLVNVELDGTLLNVASAKNLRHKAAEKIHLAAARAEAAANGGGMAAVSAALESSKQKLNALAPSCFMKNGGESEKQTARQNSNKCATNSSGAFLNVLVAACNGRLSSSMPNLYDVLKRAKAAGGVPELVLAQ
eukprot:PhM_4_TR10939/c0_g1_i1/m.40224